MMYKRIMAFAATLFLIGCSNESNATEVKEVVGMESVEVTTEEVMKTEKVKKELEVESAEFQLADYEGIWEQKHEADAPYISVEIKNIRGNTAQVFIDSMSQGAQYIASAGGEDVVFDENQALVDYEDDGSGASGEVAIELMEGEISVTIAMLQEGGPFWRLPEGEFRLMPKQEEEESIPVEEEVKLETEAAPAPIAINGQAIEGEPQTEEEYLDLATDIMAEFKKVLNSMYTVYGFGYNRPGEYATVKPHVIHLVTESFAETMLKPYIKEYYCECDMLMPGIDERLKNAVIEKVDQNTFRVVGDFSLNPMSPEPTIQTQILEFEKQDQAWKLTSWRYE